MTLFNRFLVLGVIIQAVTSSHLDDLYRSIAKVKNETVKLESSNFKLRADIKDQKDEYESNYQKLIDADLSDEKELTNIKQQINELQPKLMALYGEIDILTNHSIPEEIAYLHKIESGLKWLKENLALLQNRSSNGDQAICFKYSEENQATQIRGIHFSSLFESGAIQVKIKIAEAELAEVTIDLKKAQRANIRLHLILNADKARFEQSLADLKQGILDVHDVAGQFENLLAELKAQLPVLSEQLEELKKEYDGLLKKEKALKEEAAEVKSDLNTYDKAVQCYKKIEQIATEDVLVS